MCKQFAPRDDYPNFSKGFAAAADLDNDGKKDLLVALQGGVQVFLNTTK